MDPEAEDELLALQAIYEDKVLLDDGGGDGSGDAGTKGRIRVSVELPPDYTIRIPEELARNLPASIYSGKEEKSSDGYFSRRLQHLPPVDVVFALGPDYPASSPPGLTLECPWLPDDKRQEITEALLDLFSPGSVVLFDWLQFVQSSMLGVLGADDHMDLHQLFGDSDAVRYFQRLLMFDVHAEESQFRRDYHLCNICFTETVGEDCIRFVVCKHIFCKKCIGEYFETQIREGAVTRLLCPEPKCGTEALPTEVRQLVPTDVYDTYERLLLKASLDRHSDIVYCPRQTCGFPAIMEPNDALAVCCGCAFAFCVRCDRAWHGIEFCPAISTGAIVNEYVNGTAEQQAALEAQYGKKKIDMLVNEYKSNQWIRENSQPCPKCRAHIQKQDGCNKITCKNCSAYFCWLCGELLDQSNPYRHYSGGACGGRLFEGIVMDDNLLDDDRFFVFADD